MSVEAEQTGRPFLQRYGLSEQDYAAAGGGGFPRFIKETGCVGAVVVNDLSQLEDHRLMIEAIREPISRLFASVPQKNAGRAALPLDRRSSQLCEMTGGVLASL